MTWRAIPETEWTVFLKSFARAHDGWLVSVQLSGETELQRSRYMPLRGLIVAGDAVMVVVGDGGARRQWAVGNARRVRVDEGADRAERALRVEGTKGALQLTFRSAMATDAVDGIIR